MKTKLASVVLGVVTGMVSVGMVSITQAAPNGSGTPPRQPAQPGQPVQPATVNPVVAAQKSMNDALSNLNKAKGAVLVIRKQVAVSYEAKPEFKAAKSEYEKAKVEFDAAAQAVTAKLEADPAYKAVIVKRDKAQALMDNSAAISGPSSDDGPKITEADIEQARQDRIDTALELRKMQKESQDNDAAYAAARQKYNDSKTAYDTLEAQIDDAVKLDPQYPPAAATVLLCEANLKQARDAYLNAVKTNSNAQQRPAPQARPRK